MPAHTDMPLQGVPCSFCVFMWSHGGGAMPEQSMVMDCGAGIAMTPGSTAMANTTATRALIRERRENFLGHMPGKIGFLNAGFNQRGAAPWQASVN